MGKERKAGLPHTSHSVCCKQTARITLMLFDSKSYWSLPLLICIFPSHSQILPHRLYFPKIIFRQFKCASLTAKTILRQYYFKTRIDSAAEIRHYVGVEWSGVIQRWKMTLRHELSLSVAQIETSGWTQLQRTQTRLKRVYKCSRRPSTQTPPALLAPDTLYLRSYSVPEPFQSSLSPPG